MAGEAQRARAALESSVEVAWRRESCLYGDLHERRQITVAVADVVEALRANPAWCRSLGIGGDEMRSESD